MSVGLLALFDDIALITRAAAASLDDIVAQAGRSGVKAAGVVIDDAAVTPGFVAGFAAERELPIVWRIARGSFFNKLVVLLPISLALNAFAPWAITPLLMLGGLYLGYEGAEKVLHSLRPGDTNHPEKAALKKPSNSVVDEELKIKSAIQTDFILSAEIMAITLSTLPDGSLWVHAAVLAVVGGGITLAIYAAVAMIVKMDDLGLSLAAHPNNSWTGHWVRMTGRTLVTGMPLALETLTAVGTVAMLGVSGGILVHGTATLGWHGPHDLMHGIAEQAAHLPEVISGLSSWLAQTLFCVAVGLLVGAPIAPVVDTISNRVNKASS